MVHEPVILFFFQATHQLLVADCAQCRYRQHLCLTTGKQPRAVCPWREAYLAAERTHFRESSPVQAPLLVQYGILKQTFGDLVDCCADVLLGILVVLSQPLVDLILQGRYLLLTLQLVNYLKGIAQVISILSFDEVDDFWPGLPQGIINLGLAGLITQLFDELYDGLAGLFGHCEGLAKHLIGNLLGFYLCHHDAVGCRRHEQSEVAGFELLERGIDGELAVVNPHLSHPKGAGKRQAGQVHRCGGTNHSNDIY